MKKYNNVRNVLLVISLLALGACGGILSPVGLIAEAQKSLIITSFLLMLIVVIPVIILTVVISLKYREKNQDKSDYQPEWNHSTKLEIVWWAIPIAIILVLGVITWKTSHSLDPYKSLEHKEKPVKIQVIALNWKWLFIYPDYGIATVNYIQVPTDVPVNFEITSDAPMNSFWIPQVAGQIYAMTGMATKLHVIVSKEGEYNGVSANYSGEGFEGMKFILKASSKEEFNDWINKAKSSKNVLSESAYNELFKDSKNNPVKYFGSFKANLFKDVMMKYMGHESMNNEQHSNTNNNDPHKDHNNSEHHNAHSTN